MVAVDTRRIAIDKDTDVVSGLYVMPDCIPAVMPMLAAAPQAAPDSGIREDGGFRDVDGKICLSPGSVSGCFYDEYGGPDARAGLEEYSPVVLDGGQLLRHTPWSW